MAMRREKSQGVEKLQNAMDSKRRTPSVIGKLMGFDDIPPQNQIQKQQRVLSENYLRKTELIGLRDRRSFSRGNLNVKKIKKKQKLDLDSSSQTKNESLIVASKPKIGYSFRFNSGIGFQLDRRKSEILKPRNDRFFREDRGLNEEKSGFAKVYGGNVASLDSNSLAKIGDCSSHILDSSTQEESSIRFEEHSNEAYQPSPNSVLEFLSNEEILSSSEANPNLDGVRLQLQLLKSDSEDSKSQESIMIVSSDEESEEKSIDLLENNRKLMGFFGITRSRDFSYLVDVLDEANFKYLDDPLRPLEFDSIEKKYVDHICWPRIERRLLFDRIKFGLTKIVESYDIVPFGHKSLRKKINVRPSRNVVEEELWMLIQAEEEEINKNLSEKAVGRESEWLNFGEDVYEIAREMELGLFNEVLEEELVSTFNS